MQDLKPANVSSGGGKKKSNGHKADCGCPICKNMMKKKSGGNKYLDFKKNSTGTSSVIKGGKKSNGHKAMCKCPICVNMKHQQASKKNRRVTRGKRTRRGGDKDDDDTNDTDTNDTDTDTNDDVDDVNNKNTDDDDSSSVDDDSSSDDDKDVDDINDDDTDSKKPPSITGGRKKSKGKGGNGHKSTCKCPICKNMKKSCSVAGKSRKTRRRR
jgi:hypothetical protein